MTYTVKFDVEVDDGSFGVNVIKIDFQNVNVANAFASLVTASNNAKNVSVSEAK